MQPLSIAMRTPERIAVSRLTLTNFRCYGALRLECDGRPVALAGHNGAGKTNLLEALSFFAPGRGIRRARLEEVVRRDAAVGSAWAAAATVSAPGGDAEIGTGLATEGGPARRVVRINGAPASGQAALGEWVSMIWLTPEMDRLFTDSASARRRFLDRLVLGFDPGHAERLGAYERAMRERNRLLRDMGARGADPAWLNALEDCMAEAGVAAAAARVDVVERLGAAAALGVGPFPGASLALVGEVEAAIAGGPALNAEDGFRAQLRECRAIDAEAGRTTRGIHLSDLEVTRSADGFAAASCSTGEQKALLISIVLADARLQSLDRGTVPMLLLDEIAAHLDEERRAALFDEICALGAQAWMTGTDAVLFAPLGDRAARFRVENATVTPC